MNNFDKTTDHCTLTDPRLLEILVCPITKSNLIYNEKFSVLISQSAQIVFPIRNGIPILVFDEAEPYEKSIHGLI